MNLNGFKGKKGCIVRRLIAGRSQVKTVTSIELKFTAIALMSLPGVKFGPEMPGLGFCFPTAVVSA